MSDILSLISQIESQNYRYGGDGSNGSIDCSHLVNKMLRDGGYDIPYERTQDMANSKYFDKVSADQVRPGDIALWPSQMNDRGKLLNHTGIVLDPKDETFFGSQRKGPKKESYDTADFPVPDVFLRPKPEHYKGTPQGPSGVKPSKKTLEDIKQKMGQAGTIPSPIILDLDGDGVETTAVKSGTYFDHAGDGFAEQTGWVGRDDGLLVRDLNGNGQIDTGAELFGSETLLTSGTKAAHGFAALSELDGNGDGQIDAQDAVFSTLRIWQDADGDGITQTSELKTLAAVGVQSIAVAYGDSNLIDTNGNAHQQIGSYTTADGATRTATDVWFQTDSTHSIATEWLDVPDDIAALPNATGYGKVYDLHQAMVRDTSGQLKALVLQYTQTADTAQRDTLLTDILYRWTGVQDIDPASRSATIYYGNAIGDARKLEALEQFMGEEWYGMWCWGTKDPNPHGRAAPVILQAWGELTEFINAQLMAQTRLKPLFDKITYLWDNATQTLQGDLTGVATLLATDMAVERTTSLDKLTEFTRALKGMGALDGLDTAGFQDALAPLGQDAVGIVNTAWAGLVATNGDDVMNGTSDNGHTLRGLGGNDTLTTQGGNDTLEGGTGNDVLNGGTGDDRYLMRGGDGQDALTDTGGQDTLQLLGVNANDVTFTRDANSLYLILTDGTRAKITDWFVDAANRIEQIRLGDGTLWSATDMEARLVVPQATGNADVLYGTEHVDLIAGQEGNDILSGQAGDDTLEGGVGNDQLDGGQGNDLYVFRRGDGQDTIADTDTTVGNADAVRFGDGIAPDDVVVTRDHHNLYLSIAGTTDKITIDKWFDAEVNQVERVEFADGTAWDAAHLETLANTPTDHADYLVGDVTHDTLIGQSGDDHLFGEGGNDALHGDDGNDTLIGGVGDDSLEGGAGNDKLQGGAGNDTYLLVRGSGQDTITENDATAGNIDIIRIADGLTTDDIRIWRDPWDLHVEIENSGDRLTVSRSTVGHYNSAEALTRHMGIPIRRQRRCGRQTLLDVQGYCHEP